MIKLNKILLAIMSLPILIATAFAQHENCNHGDAPTTGSSDLGNLVQVSPTAAKNINLKLDFARQAKINTTVKAIGKIENIPQNTAALTSRIAGRVIGVWVTQGDAVKKGQTIIKVESLLAGDPPPSIEIKSPIDGIIESISVVVGSSVEPNTQLALIADTKKIYAVANVFENRISELKIGQYANIKLEAYGNETFEGKLVKFGTSLNSESNTLPVYFELSNNDAKLKNGMRAFFNIITSETDSKVVVPSNAIGGDFANKFVFVQKCPDDNVFEKTPVAVGKSDDKNTEILDGLHAGDIVATSGVYQLQFLPAPKNHDHQEDNSAKQNQEAAKAAFQSNIVKCDFETAKDENHKHSTHKEIAEESHKEEAHTHTANCNHPKAQPKAQEEHTHTSECDHADSSVNTQHSNHSSLDEFMESEYFDTLIWISLAISFLLNIIFILAAIFARRNGKIE